MCIPQTKNSIRVIFHYIMKAEIYFSNNCLDFKLDLKKKNHHKLGVQKYFLFMKSLKNTTKVITKTPETHASD